MLCCQVLPRGMEEAGVGVDVGAVFYEEEGKAKLFLNPSDEVPPSRRRGGIP